MSAMYRVVNSSKPVTTDIVTYKLESMGLILLNSFFAIPSYEVYHLYFHELEPEEGK